MRQAKDYLNQQRKSYRVHSGGRGGKTLRTCAILWPTLLLVFVGCLSHTRIAHTGPIESRPVGYRSVAFSRPLEPLTPTVAAPPQRSRRYRRLEISAPSIADNGQDDQRIHATLFETTTPEPRPLVIVLPIWGVASYPPRQIVRRLTHGPIDQQVNVLWVHGKRRLFDWEAVDHANTEADLAAILNRWTAAATGTVIDIRRLIAWAHARPAVAPNPTTVVGFSIGAIVGALVAGTDDQVHGGVFAIGGGHVDQIITTCGGKARRFRDTARERTNIAPERFATMLNEILDPIDPVHYAGTIDPRNVLVIDAEHDDCITKEGREDLWQALGRPERLTVGYKHRRAFLTMTPVGLHFATREIMSFLERTAFQVRRLPGEVPTADQGISNSVDPIWTP